MKKILTWVDRPEEAVRSVKKAMRLNPHDPVWYLIVLGWAYELMRNYDEAREVLKRALIRDLDFMSTHIILAIHYIETGQKQKAQTEVAEIVRINPKFVFTINKGVREWKS